MKEFFFSCFLLCSYILIFAQGKAYKLVQKGNEYLANQNILKAQDCYDKALSIDSMCFEA